MSNMTVRTRLRCEEEGCEREATSIGTPPHPGESVGVWCFTHGPEDEDGWRWRAVGHRRRNMSHVPKHRKPVAAVKDGPAYIGKHR